MSGRTQKYYKVRKLMEGVYSLTNVNVRMYLFVGKNHALLFDTGYGFVDWTESVRTITDLPLYVVNSHGHFDHAGGNRFYPGPIYIHEKDIQVANRHLSSEYLSYSLGEVKKMHKIFFWLPWFPKTLNEDEYKTTGAYKNYKTVQEGEVFDLGDTSLEVIELPGHTEGSIGLLHREKRCLYVSDAIGPDTYLFLPESTNLACYAKTIEKANTLEFESFFVAHIGKAFPKSELEKYLDVARNPDFENGKIRKDEFLCPGEEIRQCSPIGMKLNYKCPKIDISRKKL